MKKIFTFFVLLLLMTSCSNQIKIPCYAWVGSDKDATDQELKAQFQDLKDKGIDGLMYSGGQDPETYRHIGKIVKEVGLEFHAWIPTLIQHNNPKLKPEWYALNGLGESAYDKPAYVPHYQFACPNKE